VENPRDGQEQTYGWYITVDIEDDDNNNNNNNLLNADLYKM
jgi:hypothetical protein